MTKQANIIGKPPEQKRGAVFGDVPAGQGKESVFRRQCGTWCARMRATIPSARKAYQLDDLVIVYPDEDEPVTLLAGPPPDPAVTTYGELEAGEWRFDDEGELTLCGQTVDVSISGLAVDHAFHDDLVRRVSPIEAAAHVLGPDAGASVVVHEEPGAELREAQALFMQFGLRLVDIVRQGATLLSTREPATADPEPSTWYESEARKNGHAEGCARTKWDTNPCTCPELAEDRTKPAPGWKVSRAASCDYTLRRPDGVVWAYDINSKAAAVAMSWERWDAEQARKAGGES